MADTKPALYIGKENYVAEIIVYRPCRKWKESYSLFRVLRLLIKGICLYFTTHTVGISGPKAEKGPWEPDELVGFPPSPLHGVQGEPGTLLVAGKERTNRGIPREFPALFMHQGIIYMYLIVGCMMCMAECTPNKDCNNFVSR